MTAGKVSFGRYWAIRAIVAAGCALACLPAAAADRVAMLIGNNQYDSNALRNAVNDARDLGEVLKELGFQVIVRENASRRDMIEAIREFGQAIDGASVALFFYAGHAMQFKERNYLIPIDAALGSEEDVTFFSVEIGQIFDRMDRARTRFNFIILDACRDNPFAASFKLTSTGLAQMSSPSGTLIAYATSPGSTAADGFGRNGIYTKHILQNIRVPDLPVEIMFKRVREGVERETRKQQTPWDSSSLKGDFAFNAVGAHASAAAPAAGPSADATLQIEREFWISVRDSSWPEDIRAYLDKYPNGNFAALARNKLDALVRPTRVAAAELSPPRSPAPVETPASTARAPAATSPASVATAPASAATSPASVATAPAPAATSPVSVATAPASAAAVPAPAATAPAQRHPQLELTSAPKAAAEKPVVVATAPPSAPGARTPEPIPGREIAPGVRELTYADGSVYRGAMRGASLHGKGEFVSKAFKYEGEFNEGLKDGEGTYVWENGDRYEGHFSNDRPDGRGKFRFSNGDAYEGEVKLGVIVGRGTYVTKSGDVIEGSFANGKAHGVGVFRFANGDRYEGDLQGGALTGHGSYFFGSGMKYEGEMRLGQPQGKGVYWFLDGTRFEGVFENGLARARGEIVTQNGSRVPAEIVDGKAKLLN